MIPFGKARRQRRQRPHGHHLRSYLAARPAGGAGAERTWQRGRGHRPAHAVPLRLGGDRYSVSKTSRALVVHEDMLSWGYGAEIAARIADELFDQLDAPVRRLAAKDTFVAYQPELENVILPQTSDILAAMLKLARY